MFYGLVAIGLFAALMFTRRRLEKVEAEARSLKDAVETLKLRLQLQADEHRTRFDRLEQGAAPRAPLQADEHRTAVERGAVLRDPLEPSRPPALQPSTAGLALQPSAADISSQPSAATPSTGAPPPVAATPPPVAATPPPVAAGTPPVAATPPPAAATPPLGAGASAPGSAASPPGSAATPPAAATPQSGAGASPPGGAARPPPIAARQPAPAPDPFEAGFAALRELLFGGNTVVRAGILILLVGVVLLLRWAAEAELLPIELRLAGAALLAIGLIGVGFRQRTERPEFSRALQGGGVAALYLVVFFAFRTYALIPAGLAFTLLVGIAVCSGALAVLQDSRTLILIGQVFGFAAPLLASTGQGSHVALFSYYLVLNLVVAGVAWFKAWRVLNLLGFAFTFGVASAWGVLRYEPEHFASTEPFLIAFFLLYVSLPVLFALRHPTATRGWVDGTLVFGTPLAALGLQWSLVNDRPFGMAFTALGMAAVYLGLAWIMKRRAPERLAALAEAFLPIGAGFATLAIPYGFDNHNLTGAAWAIEGAGLYWLGVRQRRWLSRTAGVVLQLLAGGAIGMDPIRPESSLPILNTWFLAGTLLGLASLFIAYYAYAHRDRVEREWQLLQALVGWGLLFILVFGAIEVDDFAPTSVQAGALIAWLGAAALALELVAGKLDWQPARYLPLLLWPAMVPLLARHHFDFDTHPLARGGWFGWPVYAAAMLVVLRRFVGGAPIFVRFAHPLALWLWAAWTVSLVHELVADATDLDASYITAAGLTTLTAIVVAVVAASRGDGWPIGAERERYLNAGAGTLVLVLMLATLVANLSRPGSSAPIPYLPILNALDLALLLAYAAVAVWLRRAAADGGEGKPIVSADLRTAAAVALAALVFVFWNSLLARTVHHWAAVPFRASALWSSAALQVAFSLSWTLIALGLMLGGHRRRSRTAWWTGAALQTVVVGKLFVLDLAELSAPAKIGTFLGVGLLLLVVGALAPVPPASDDEPHGAPPPGTRTPETPS